MRKIKKYMGVVALVLVATLVLSACGATNNPNVTPHSGIYGWVYQWLGRPLQNIMIQTAHMIGGENGAGDHYICSSTHFDASYVGSTK